MVKASTSCSTCGVPIKRLVKEYKLRAHPSRKQYLVGKFTSGFPGMKAKKGESTSGWEMKQAGENEDELSLKDTTAGGRSFDGKLEGGQKANYMLFVMQGADFLGMLSGDWYTFKPTIKHQTLTLEEAEARMASRSRAAEGSQKWMQRGETIAQLPGGAAPVSDDDENEEGGSESEEEDKETEN
eukprot:CAMPEP_0198205000 /NCGR_PEP_ID=MMETSP1445-20131203/8483_1 /TAXON_ID=36898 /ORGANISM="Pyramimonas sp., Strain CCMP2087" /LENGTH=183 /DNA_ID=CAMNT_0043877129 /DNA_START=463 /DNA_END=1011 /DNA_ORIENTATION=-